MLEKLTGNAQEDINTVLADLTALSKTLRANNQKLFDFRNDLYAKKRQKKAKQKELTQSHDRLKAVIANETEPRSQKSRFSNEIKRQAEFLERSAGDPACRELEEQIDSLALSAAEIDNAIESVLFEQSLFKDDYVLGTRLLEVLNTQLLIEKK
jgi:hypothetical protein